MFEKYLFVFVISMVPLVELRGAIPIALGMGLDPLPSIAVCSIGNLLPVPVIYLYAHKFLIWGLDKPVIGSICRFCHDKGEAASARMQGSLWGKYGMLFALAAFVGIPIPGTGAWTGTLGASFLGMGKKQTAVAVTIGIAIAACIMSSVSMVGAHVFGL